ncbi:hypothetical protein WHZ78_17555 [Bradyrhizobium symbiodeficiens]|uniref:hypothetical protein n=1 Tax=Bradyrhizobium symbiodeficiens TaxID=1404367 RepID=UPI0030CC93C3
MTTVLRHPNAITELWPSTGELCTRLAAQERAREKALKRLAKLRKKAAAEITRLIAFLDASDPYVMTEHEEECEDEGAQCEDEGSEHDGREPDADDEPSLGGVDPSMGGGDQTRWAAGGRRDLESDPAESGIGDHDGLLEQGGQQRDWTCTVIA